MQLCEDGHLRDLIGDVRAAGLLRRFWGDFPSRFPTVKTKPHFVVTGRCAPFCSPRICRT